MQRTRRHTFNLNAYLDQVTTVEESVTLTSPTWTEPCTATVTMTGGSGQPAQLTVTTPGQAPQSTTAMNAPLNVTLPPGQALTAAVRTRGEPAEIELIVSFTYVTTGSYVPLPDDAEVDMQDGLGYAVTVTNEPVLVDVFGMPASSGGGKQ